MTHIAVPVGIGCLSVAALVTFWTMLHGAGGTFEWNWFYPWALSPYIILGVLFATLGGRTKTTRHAAFLAAVLVSVGAVYLYVDAMFLHVSSTSALVHLFGPLYLLGGGLAVFAITALVGRWLRAPNDT